eukprot:SAG25_NODE_4438_length_815_cov_1.560056_1_plen_76_part_00
MVGSTHDYSAMMGHNMADITTARPLERMVMDASGSTLVTAPGAAAAAAAALPAPGGATPVATGGANIRSHWPSAS